MQLIKRFYFPFLFAIIFAVLHFGAWAIANRALPLINVEPIVHGFAYSGYQEGQSPLERSYPNTVELAQDLKLLKKLTNRIRIYTSIENSEVVALADKEGLSVIAGAWINQNAYANSREIAALKEKMHYYDNIEAAIVGNEVLLRNELTVDGLIEYLDDVREATEIPISTAEPWHVWLKNPDLVKHVDYIAVHLLPYHEGVPVEQAPAYAIERYQELMKAYPRKRIVITEIGWPSSGPTIGGSIANDVNQARFVREFLAKNETEHYEYYLMEAIDQPWKVNIEGWAGAYWGMFDAKQVEKYSLQGSVAKDDRWVDKAIWASLIALIPIIFIGWRFRSWGIGGIVSMAILLQACITTLVIAWNLPGDYYYSLRDFIILAGLILAMALTSLVLMIYAVEFSEVMFKRNWRRIYSRKVPLPADKELFVSIHLACYNEPPEMVIATIESLKNLDYTNYEVIVVDNNTKDEAKWKPIKAYMAGLPSNFHFYHLPKWPGFKAGALNLP
jgi:exo-beta-1,3-glucanase (GH17 family)